MPTTRVGSVDDYQFHLDRAFDGLRVAVLQLGDERVNRRPAWPGANTAYGLVTHCLGVANYWVGALVAGRSVERDRAAEFEAVGTVADLVAALDYARARLHRDLKVVDPSAQPSAAPDPGFLGPERVLDCGGVLLHVFEEFVQHLGQLEVLRDALLADSAADAPPFEPPLAWLRAKRGVKWRRPGPDLLPAWVADMDFAVAPPIRAALIESIDRGDLGYPDWFDGRHPLAVPFAERMMQRFEWKADPDSIRGVTDIVSALQIVLHLATAPGDGVVLQEPNYPPFRATVPTMGRRPVPLRVMADGDSWRHDLQALDEALQHGPGATVLLLVNPHNPTGRAFDRAELEDVAELAARHDLLVVSDEIHADLVYAPNRHTPFASLGPEVEARTVTLTSATKAFNIAGLRTAVAHIGPPALLQRWDAEPPDLHGVASTLGVIATHAAWTAGDEWLSSALSHLRRQRDRLLSGLAGVPGLSLRRPEATYLAWLDWSEACLGEEAAQFLRREAGVYASPGPDYGGTSDWLRLNFATSTEVLDRIVAAMLTATQNRSVRHNASRTAWQ